MHIYADDGVLSSAVLPFSVCLLLHVWKEMYLHYDYSLNGFFNEINIFKEELKVPTLNRCVLQQNISHDTIFLFYFWALVQCFSNQPFFFSINARVEICTTLIQPKQISKCAFFSALKFAFFHHGVSPSSDFSALLVALIGATDLFIWRQKKKK